MPAGSGARVRVVSYNIHGQRDDRTALGEVVRDLAPDVLLVQEAPRRFWWRSRCAALARGFGLVVAAGGLPGLGNLVLTALRVQVEHSRCVRFPLTPGRHLRGAVLVRCTVAGVPITVVGSHLGIDPAERPGHARLLRAELGQADPPVILGADLNDEPGGPAWQAVAEGLTDSGDATPTFPASRPHRRIDAILVGPGLEVGSYRVVDTPAARRASDHLPVMADIQLGPPPVGPS